MLAYKYCSGNSNHINSLKESYFWSADKNSLNDPCEALFDGHYYKNEIELLVKLFHIQNDNKVNDSLSEFHNKLEDLYSSISKSGIFSLSRIFTDELLWAHYANSHKGICIEFDTEILNKNTRNDFFIFEVIYKNSLPEIDMNAFIKIIEVGACLIV